MSSTPLVVPLMQLLVGIFFFGESAVICTTNGMNTFYF